MIKNLFRLVTKHFTRPNLIQGLLVLIIVGLIKYFGIAYYVIEFFTLPNTPFTEYIITGLISLISRLGLKGIVEEGYFTIFMTMGPNEVGSSSNTNAAGSGNSPANNTTGTGSSSSNTNAAGSGNSPTNNTTGTGSSSTNTVGVIEVDPNPAPYRPLYERSMSPTEAEIYGAYQGVLNLFNEIPFRYTYLDWLQENTKYGPEYQKVSPIFKELASIENKITILESGSKDLEKNPSSRNSNQLQRYKYRLQELYEKKEDLKKKYAPQIAADPVVKFEAMDMPLTKRTHNFSDLLNRTHKRDHSINSDEAVKRPKLSEDASKK